MSPVDVKRIAQFAREVGHVLLVTADASGKPHLAVAGALEAGNGNELIVSEWCCPATLDNLDQNAQVALVAWDPEMDDGFQVIGRVTRSEEIAIQDGLPDLPRPPEGFPQAEKRLFVAIDDVLKFVRGRHRDRPGWGER
jgi:hypothetical protein